MKNIDALLPFGMYIAFLMFMGKRKKNKNKDEIEKLDDISKWLSAAGFAGIIGIVTAMGGATGSSNFFRLIKKLFLNNKLFFLVGCTCIMIAVLLPIVSLLLFDDVKKKRPYSKEELSRKKKFYNVMSASLFFAGVTIFAVLAILTWA